MNYLVTCDLHAPGPEQRNTDSGERRATFKGRARARVVHYLVATHVKHTRRTRFIGEDQHPYAVVVGLVTDDLAVEGITHQDAQKVTEGFVGSPGRYRRFRWQPRSRSRGENHPHRVRRHRIHLSDWRSSAFR